MAARRPAAPHFPGARAHRPGTQHRRSAYCAVHGRRWPRRRRM